MFKRKTIDLKFYTANKSAFDLFPPINATKKLPSWFQKASDEKVNLSVKHCRGMRDFFRYGIAIPMWSDLRLATTDDQISWEFSDKMSQILVETGFQAMQRKNEALVKLIAPWAVECSEPVAFMQAQNMWEPEASPFRSINATLDFKYQHAVNTFLYVPTNVDVIIPAGTVSFVFAPLTERPVNLSVEYNPTKHDELKHGGLNRPFFKNWYAKQRRICEERK
jgi:hypothetical protein